MKRIVIALLASLFVLPALADHGIKRGDGNGVNRCRNAQDQAKCEAREAKIESAKAACKDKPAAEIEACVTGAVCGEGSGKRCRATVAKRLK